MKLYILMFLGIINTSTIADSELGQKYYVIYMKEETGLKGSIFTKQYAQAEWKELFDEDGKKFINQNSKKYPKLKSFLNSVEFQNVRIDIRDFCIEFAKDTMGMASGC